MQHPVAKSNIFKQVSRAQSATVTAFMLKLKPVYDKEVVFKSLLKLNVSLYQDITKGLGLVLEFDPDSLNYTHILGDKLHSWHERP